MDWKRPKEVKSTTENIKTECGTLNVTKGYDGSRLIEIFSTIGKSGTCCNCHLYANSRFLTFYLQSPEPRYKIVKKIKKSILKDTKSDGVSCGMPFTHDGKQYRSCIEFIGEYIIDEIDR